MEASLNINLDKAALCLSPKVEVESHSTAAAFYRHHFWPVLNVPHLRRRGDECCGYQVSSLEIEMVLMRVCVCVCE